MSVDITRAEAIQGWMGPLELTWLAERAREHKVIVEIGCWKGRSARAMADNMTEGSVLYAVDTWKGSPELMGELEGKPEGWLLAQFALNLASHIWGGRVIIPDDLFVHLLYDQVPEVDVPMVEMVFIDGAHDYDSVRRDITKWWAIPQLLCGHDYYGDYPGVRKAVDELIPDVKVVPDTSIWYTEAR